MSMPPTQNPESAAATGPASTADTARPAGTPNQYHLHGGGISVSYIPDGTGPLTTAGPVRFTYQDAHQSLIFRGGDVRTVDVPDLGTIISVTLVRTIDIGYTSFSLLLPHVTLPSQLGATMAIKTNGITTVHRTFLATLGQGQTETSTITRLIGTAAIGILPD